MIPDVAILHVQEADAAGNGRIIGTRFEDVLMAQAARRVILTAERIVDGDAFAEAPESVAIPGFLVDTVVEAPGGAWPFSCTPFYGYDAAYLAAWVEAARNPDDRARIHRRPIPDPLSAVPGVIDPGPASRRWDMMAVAMARLAAPGETVFHGVASPLPMVATLLAKQLHAPRSHLPEHHRRGRRRAGESAGVRQSIRRCCMGPGRWSRWPISSTSLRAAGSTSRS